MEYGRDIQTEVLDALQRLEGLYWREAAGELQENYKEFALWILLYEDSNVRESHRALCDILQPLMALLEPNQFTVSYIILTDKLDIQVDMLNTNREILAAGDDPKFAQSPVTSSRNKHSIFKTMVSGKRPV